MVPQSNLLKLVRDASGDKKEFKKLIETLDTNTEEQIATIATREARNNRPRILEMTDEALEQIMNKLFTDNQKGKYGRKCHIIGGALMPGIIKQAAQKQSYPE